MLFRTFTALKKMMRLIIVNCNNFILFLAPICAILQTVPQTGREVKVKVNRGVQAQFVSVLEAETQTGVSRWTWRRWAYDGKIGSVKLGRRLLLPISEIERLVAQNSRPALER